MGKLPGKEFGSSSEKLNIELLYDPAIPPLGIYLRELKQMFTQDLNMNVYSSITHDRQKGGTTQMSVNCIKKNVNKQNVVRPYNEILFNQKKGGG